MRFYKDGIDVFDTPFHQGLLSNPYLKAQIKTFEEGNKKITKPLRHKWKTTKRSTRQR